MIPTDHEVEAALRLQEARTADWHRLPAEPSHAGFLGLVEDNHRCNFELWHEEDKARRDDLGYEHVYRAKRSIDRWNQRRNDCIEKLDRWMLEGTGAFAADTPMNSETPGMILDRLSILALKAFHMREESERADATHEHRAASGGKLEVILRQRRDLAQALAELTRGVAAGTRGFRAYHQFKMYNDPALNPELYRSGT